MPEYTATFKRSEPGYGDNATPITKTITSADNATAYAMANDFFGLPSRAGTLTVVAVPIAVVAPIIAAVTPTEGII